MRIRVLCAVFLALSGLGVPGCSHTQAASEQPQAEEGASPPSLTAFTAELAAHEGFVKLWSDAARGKVYAELDASTPLDCLYAEGLARGLGANPAGLDRGELGVSLVLRIRVVGERALFEALNTDYRASSGDADEGEAARAAFPTSVLVAAPVVAREGQRVLVDLEPFILRDAHGVVAQLAARGEGKWSFDAQTSAVELGAVRAFPDNVELEGTTSFTSSEPGAWAGSTAPHSERLGLRQHHSLIRLPAPGFVPRDAPERMGLMETSHLDFSAELAAPLQRSLARRHRLVEGETLVYYLDRGTPEPIRSALLEGAGWWADAFAQAGVPGDFRVELLPAGADPLDVRYNMIHWVHRSTRGWSYGGSIYDPRSGEILKGNVVLGSQRVRQDRRIFEALLGAQDSGAGGPEDPVEHSLARLRQLAAHEVGHTLGFAHNFAASSYGRASVMDYPAPLVRVIGEGSEARVDASSAYAVGLGEWDRLAFAYLYREWDTAQEQAQGLAALMAEADARQLWLLSDAETHARGAAHPEAAVWDNGADSVVELREVLAVRALALRRFGAHNLAAGADPSELELTLAPLYFFHRYQLAAAAKRIAGQRFELGPQLQANIAPVPAAQQREALELVLSTLAPSVLELPPQLGALMRPTPAAHIDALPSYAGPSFDPYALAAAAASMSVVELLAPERAHRLEAAHAEDAAMLGFVELLDTSMRALWGPLPAASRAVHVGPAAAELLREQAREAFVEGMLGLATSQRASPRVRALAEQGLRQLATRLARAKRAHDRALWGRITRWLERGHSEGLAPQPLPPAPPGSPIGSASGSASVTQTPAPAVWAEQPGCSLRSR